MKKTKYELYAKFESAGSRPYYMFIRKSNSANDLVGLEIGQECKYILINNNYPLTLIDGRLVSEEEFDTEEYYNMILECKISKCCDSIKAVDEDVNVILSQIDIEIDRARIETEEYFERIKLNL